MAVRPFFENNFAFLRIWFVVRCVETRSQAPPRVRHRALREERFIDSCRFSGKGSCVTRRLVQGALASILIRSYRCRANMAHIRQSRPDYSLDFQTKILEMAKIRSMCSLFAGENPSNVFPLRRRKSVECFPSSFGRFSVTVFSGTRRLV